MFPLSICQDRARVRRCVNAEFSMTSGGALALPLKLLLTPVMTSISVSLVGYWQRQPQPGFRQLAR